MIGDTPRPCATCGEMYTPHREAAGNSTYCGSSCREKARRLRHGDKRRAKDREYGKRPEVRAVTIPRNREWREANRERARAHTRKHELKKKYGMTPEDYESRLIDQGGRCAICRTDDPAPWEVFVVDHSHTTGVVRGLLCAACNSCLGQAGDDPTRLRAAAQYLERHQ